MRIQANTGLLAATALCLIINHQAAGGDCEFRWRELVAEGSANSPGRLVGRAAAFDSFRQVEVLFGGDNPIAEIHYTDETWEWNGALWTRRLPTVQPQKRRDAAMAYDSDRKVCVLFGGGTNIFQHEIPFNDTWEWDGTTWTLRVADNPASITQPPPIMGPVMVYDSFRKKTVLFGATDRSGGTFKPLTNTWEWNGSTWSKFDATPSPRVYTAMAYDPVRKNTVLYGGHAFYDPGYYNDTWTWDGANWSQVAVGGPLPLGEHAMAFDLRRNVLVLFGGSQGLAATSETWEWNGNTWTFLTNSSANGPTVRRAHVMWYDSGAQRLMVHGGLTPRAGIPNQTVLDDIYEARPPGIWIDFAYPGLPALPELGLFANPYNSVAEGVAGATAGCTLHLKAGTTPETITILKPLTLQTYNGPVTIGGQ